jgi:hypothetical protein
MKKLLVLLVPVAAALAVLASPARSIDQVNDCPADFRRVAVQERGPADRNGDGVACVLPLTAAELWTDNAIGNPNILPPGPCTGAYLPLTIGDPNVIGDPGIIGDPSIIGDPHIRAIDANRDGTVCAAASASRLILILLVLDNPNDIAGTRG